MLFDWLKVCLLTYLSQIPFGWNCLLSTMKLSFISFSRQPFFSFCSLILTLCNICFSFPVADLLYRTNMHTGSVLEYTLAFASAALDRYRSKWSAAPKTGFIDITTSKDFYRVYSGLQFVSYTIVLLSPEHFHLVGARLVWLDRVLA